jgi:mannose-6-phosphate isomerase
MVWGGPRLGQLFEQPPGDVPIGEAWVLSDHALHRSALAGGRTLRHLMEQERPALLGPASAELVFPWLIKFLDAHDWLSVQVHPDDEQARQLWPGEGGKTEAWYVLDAAPGSRIYAGLKPGVDAAQLRAALQAGTVADCLHSFEPRPGDCVFLPAGTVHAVGGGVLMAEVQQTSDATFRLFDYNRRDAEGRLRPLHIEQAMACIDWSRGPVTPVRAAAPRQTLVHCRYFTLEYLEESRPFLWGGEGQLQAVVVLRGRGRLGNRGELVTPGQAWLLPAAMPPVECRPETPLTLLLCTLP